MPKVTKIVRQKRDASRVSVFIDDAFAFGIEESLLFSLHIHVGEELGPVRQRELEQGALLSSARNTAQRYLSRSMRSTHEVRQRLKEKGIPAVTIEETIEWLAGYGFLNDEEYARAFIRTRLQLRPAGKSKLKQDLLKKGIPPLLADKALAEYIDADADRERAIGLARAYRAKNSRLEPMKLQRRLAGYLQRRGFHTGDVLHAMKETLGPAEPDE